MLHTQGLFRSNPCPFFLAGLCERPHCTFRHCGSDIQLDRKNETCTFEESTTKKDSQDKETRSASISSGNSVSSHSPKEADSSRGSDLTRTFSRESQEKESKRLGNHQDQDTERPRKRSRTTSDSKDPDNHTKISTPSEEMGAAVSIVKNLNKIFIRATSKSENTTKKERERKNRRDDELDRIVRDIEKAGISQESVERESHHRRSLKKHKHGKRDHREKDKYIKSRKDQQGNSTSHRKENKATEDAKSNRGKDHRHKPTTPSSSTVSKSKQDDKYKARRRDFRGDGKRYSYSSSRDSSSSASKQDLTTSESEMSSGGLVADRCSIDISNRFDILQQMQRKTLRQSVPAEESQPIEEEVEEVDEEEVEEESLEFKYTGSDSDEDPEVVARECLEMFESYTPEETPTKPPTRTVATTTNSDPDEGYSVVGKKRVAHANASDRQTPSSTGSSSSTQSNPQKPPVTTRTLQEAVCKRYEEQSKSTGPISSTTTSLNQSNPPKPVGRMRIAHVPNASKLAQRPVIPTAGHSIPTLPKCSPTSSAVPGQPGSLTYSQTASKGTARQAHQPSKAITSRAAPLIMRDAINKGIRIPHYTRQRVMDQLFAEFSRVMEDKTKAFEETVKRENELYSKHHLKQIYYNAAVSIIAGCRSSNGPSKLLRGEANVSSSPIPNRVVSHQEILSGSLTAKNCSYVSRRGEVPLPTGNELYLALLPYVLTEQQLIDNGYPRDHPSGQRGRAVAKPRIGDDSHTMTLTERKCDRCKIRYSTTIDGFHVEKDICSYHWGRKYSTISRAGRGARECSYTCCGSDDDKMGCSTAVCHVSRSPVPISEQFGFVDACGAEGDEATMGLGAWDVIGIDCEMVYTTHGSELARLTVVGADMSVLYDEVVMPLHTILDCNTRFSGLSFSDFDKPTKTFTEVQAVLLCNIRPNTIIIGHSLESDLLALKFKHDCVIDTTLLYPHRMGPPQKRALKNLSAEILKKVIQESEHGHDSAEDASIALELVLAKVKKDHCRK